MFLINGPLWIITAVVLTDLSTVDIVVNPFNNWWRMSSLKLPHFTLLGATNFTRIICYEL
jgi:Holliday junction resolvasome RuvABC ATP-dependent DNA helicase subunit